MNLNLTPIGTIICDSVERYSQPHQPQISLNKKGMVQLFKGQNFEAALEDLQGFDKIWLIFGFHKSRNWNAKVSPPRSPKTKRGLFSTRSPHRPNALGLSCVDLEHIEGLQLHIQHHDLLDGSPIYDIKPYLAYCDSHPDAKMGWVEDLKDNCYTLSWSEKAKRQKFWLQQHQLNILELIESTLCFYPEANPRKRIVQIHENQLELAVKTWRVSYLILNEKMQVHILEFTSGYDEATLKGLKASKWNDVPLHRLFVEEFNND